MIGVVVVVVTVAAPISNQSIFCRAPVKVSRIVCWPAPSASGTVTVWYALSVPVSGTLTVPLGAPSTETAIERAPSSGYHEPTRNEVG